MGSTGTATTLSITGNLSLADTAHTTLSIYGNANSDALSLGTYILMYGGTLTLDFETLVTSGSNALFLFAGESSMWTSVDLTGSYAADLTWTGGTWSGTSNGETFSLSDQTGQLSYQAAAAPEPGTWALLVAGVCVLTVAGLVRARPR